MVSSKPAVSTESTGVLVQTDLIYLSTHGKVPEAFFPETWEYIMNDCSRFPGRKRYYYNKVTAWRTNSWNRNLLLCVIYKLPQKSLAAALTLLSILLGITHVIVWYYSWQFITVKQMCSYSDPEAACTVYCWIVAMETNQHKFVNRMQRGALHCLCCIIFNTTLNLMLFIGVQGLIKGSCVSIWSTVIYPSHCLFTMIFR